MRYCIISADFIQGLEAQLGKCPHGFGLPGDELNQLRDTLRMAVQHAPDIPEGFDLDLAIQDHITRSRTDEDPRSTPAT